ncbi:hypothetical protein Sgou_44650 [Streptomyces gougerotii]|uniref:Uncharacterized protein n=1 Tax=Streptomyces gougerotii TaxID=53448 RepID=A0ABQ1DB58_9ACTN|nr:hypothetical protein Sgou_44650 [Streptomyces gougerotii]
MFYCGGDYEARKGFRDRAGLDQSAPRRPPARAAARGLRACHPERSSSTSWPSWWTPSARWNSVRRARACDDGVYAYSWAKGGKEAGK